jgi:hypothetical protein
MSMLNDAEVNYGRIGYDAYGETANWKTFDGRPMPTWDELSETETGRETQRRWHMAARAILLNAID